MTSSLRVRLGFSLIEIMISISILAIAVFAILGVHANLQQARVLAQGQNQLISFARMMVDRVVATDFADLNDPVRAPWSRMRIKEDGGFTYAGNLPPLSGADLKALTNGTRDIQNLNVYIEYYRAVRADYDLKTGLSGTASMVEVLEQEIAAARLAGTITNDSQAADFFRQKVKTPAFRNTYLIPPEEAGVAVPLTRRTDIAEDDLVLIRILVVWGERQYSLFTAKRKETLP